MSSTLAPLPQLAHLIPIELFPSRWVQLSPENNETLGTIDFTREINPNELSDPGWLAFHTFQVKI